MIDPSANLWQQQYDIIHSLFIMGRKRNQGKARRAAKAKAAKAREDAQQSRGSSSQTTEAVCIYKPGAEGKCYHGSDPSEVVHRSVSFRFLYAFRGEFEHAIKRTPDVRKSLLDARKATMNQYTEVWTDSAKMKMAITLILGMGTHDLLGGKYVAARKVAAFIRFFEQDIAVNLKQTQALIYWPKIVESYAADKHSLVKFFRHRLPCSCLDKKYNESKSIMKVGFCYARGCRFHFAFGGMKRSCTKYCSRCHCATYCSRKCQELDWAINKPLCDEYAEVIAEFEASQQKLV